LERRDSVVRDLRVTPPVGAREKDRLDRIDRQLAEELVLVEVGVRDGAGIVDAIRLGLPEEVRGRVEEEVIRDDAAAERRARPELFEVAGERRVSAVGREVARLPLEARFPVEV